MTGNPAQPELAPAVRRKLRFLRWWLRSYFWEHGLNLALAWLGVAFWMSLAIDWLFEPPLAVRRAVFGIVGLVLVWVLLRTIFCRAFVRLSDLNLAMLVERRFPQFDESLLTAVALAGRDGWHWHDASSTLGPYHREMLARTCRRAAEPIREVRLRKVVNLTPLRLSAVSVSLLDFAIAAFILFAPDVVDIWARRNLLLRDEPWPRQTRLLVEGFENGVTKVARGDDLEVIAKADLSMPVVPNVVEVRYRTEGGAPLRAAMSREGTGDPARSWFQEYSHTFRGVLTPIRFDLVGGDATVRDLRIEVVDSPTLVEMVLECRFADYMDRPTRTLPVTGVMQLPVGTAITVRAMANKDLVKAEIDDGEGSTAIGELAPHPSPLTPRHSSAASGFRRFAYRLADFTEDKNLLFTLFDTDGIKSREPVRLALRALADEPPHLTVDLNGIGSAITPQARIPAAGHVTDDYGIARIWFDYTIDQKEPATRPVESLSGNCTDFRLDHALDVRDLKLTAGQKLLVCVKAADRYDLAEGPNVGTSQRWPLDVVTPEQLRTILQARELVLRQRFERIIQEVTETRDSLLRIDFDTPAREQTKSPSQDQLPSPRLRGEGSGVRGPGTDGRSSVGRPATTSGSDASGNQSSILNHQSSIPSGAEPGDEPDEGESRSGERILALRTLRVQRALQDARKNAHETLGVSEAFSDIREELVNNRIDTAELKTRLQYGIADPLRRIAEEMFPELDRRLDRLEGTLADDAGPANRKLAVAQVDAILLAMQDVLQRMLELEDFNKAVELLREIIHAQERLTEQTRERHEQKLRELLESDANAAAPPATTAEPSPADRLSVEEQQIADNFQHLQDVLLRMAELSEVTDPRRAVLLRKAVRQSEERLIGVQFETLVDLLEKDRLSQAIENQDNLQQDLQTLLELLLSENRARRIESEKARIRDYLKRLDRIIREQKGIQGRTAGSGRPDPLADEQQRLADKTGDLANDIKRNEEPAGAPADESEADGRQAESRQDAEDQGEGKQEAEPEGKEGKEGPQSQQEGKAEGEPSDLPPSGREGQGQSRPQTQGQNQNAARPRIEAARERMREAHEKLKEAEREGAVERQEEAIRELEQAKAELEEILRQLREEEVGRMLTMLETRFLKMLQMQRDVYEGTLRLDKVPEPDRTHNHEIEASRLGRKEAEIVLEADKALALLRDDGTAVAFPEAVEQVRQDMHQVVVRLDQANVGQITQTIEEEIIAALEEMIEALRQAQQDSEKQQQMPMPPGPPQDQPLVDLLAEIKMIRAMQMRVNRRTERYSKLVDGEQAENPDLLEALARLAERQARIHQITRDLEQGRNR